MYEIHQGECLDRLKTFDDNSVDSIVTDPPYGLSFMGRKWDYDVPSVDIWRECLRVLKPGGHLLAFAGARTQHRMAVNIEDAGFEIRDMIAWVYGSGFPKSLDVSKAIDKSAGAEREVVGANPTFRKMQDEASAYNLQRNEFITAPATDAARQWQGWGTALKPALEPITVARKPLSEGTVAANVLAHGTGALNIDGCRVESERATGWGGGGSALYEGGLSREGGEARPVEGRWPANLIHDGSEEVLAAFPRAPGQLADASTSSSSMKNQNVYGAMQRGAAGFEARGDTGSAARFFYCAKAAKKDRGDGNNHPTVKPTDLMRYLCRLVTPPGGVVLDLFTGSGSTGKAAVLEGFRFIGIEREYEYCEIAKARIAAAVAAIAEELAG